MNWDLSLVVGCAVCLCAAALTSCQTRKDVKEVLPLLVVHPVPSQEFEYENSRVIEGRVVKVWSRRALYAFRSNGALNICFRRGGETFGELHRFHYQLPRGAVAENTLFVPAEASSMDEVVEAAHRIKATGNEGDVPKAPIKTGVN